MPNETNEILEVEEMDIAPAEERATELSVAGNTVYDRIMEQVVDYGFCSTFSTEDRDGQLKLYKARNASQLLKNFMNTPIDVVHAAWAPAQVSDESGELKTVLAVYLIDSEGSSYMSTAGGVCKSAAELFSLTGELASWEGDPVTIVCLETNTAKGRRYKYLDVE